MTRPTLMEKLTANTRVTNGCWLWEGSRYSNGYGRVGYGGSRLLVHRVAYELANGPIPTGLVIDHLCRVVNCINPDHLEAVSHKENTLRGVSYIAERARATHCIRGHELTSGNLHQRADGRRRCLTCGRAAQEARNAARRAARKRAAA